MVQGRRWGRCRYGQQVAGIRLEILTSHRSKTSGGKITACGRGWPTSWLLSSAATKHAALPRVNALSVVEPGTPRDGGQIRRDGPRSAPRRHLDTFNSPAAKHTDSSGQNPIRRGRRNDISAPNSTHHHGSRCPGLCGHGVPFCHGVLSCHDGHGVQLPPSWHRSSTRCLSLLECRTGKR